MHCATCCAVCLVAEQQLPALLVVVLVDADQQPHALLAGRSLQRVRDEDALEGLEKRAAQVVGPERVQVLQLGELDVADDGAEVPSAQQKAGAAEQFKLPLQRLLLVRGDPGTQGGLVLQVLGPNTQPDVCHEERRKGGEWRKGKGKEAGRKGG